MIRNPGIASLALLATALGTAVPTQAAPPLPAAAVPPIIAAMCNAAPGPQGSGLEALQVLAKFDFAGAVTTSYVCMAGPVTPRLNLSAGVTLLDGAGAAMGAGAGAPTCLAANGTQAAPACTAPRFVLVATNRPHCPTGPASCPARGERPARAQVSLAWQDARTGPVRRLTFTVPVQAI
ncbi:MAG: hypothetical protein KGL44_04385 [Sphingomonadales bacterium]|nr:hypothetical protein [Sphingomonadales bacterium]